MKTTKKLSLGLFIAMSGVVFSSTAQAGPTYVHFKDISPPASTCDLQNATPTTIHLDDGDAAGFKYVYKCPSKNTYNGLKSRTIWTSTGSFQCSYTIHTWSTGFFNQNWHHEVRVNPGSGAKCLVGSINNDNTFLLGYELESIGKPM